MAMTFKVLQEAVSGNRLALNTMLPGVTVANALSDAGITPEDAVKLARLCQLFVVGSADTTGALTEAEKTEALARFDQQKTEIPSQQGPAGSEVTGFMWRDKQGGYHLQSMSGKTSGSEHWTRLFWAAGHELVWVRSQRLGDQGLFGEQEAQGHFQLLYDVVTMPSADLAPDITEGRPNEVVAGGLNIYSDISNPQNFPDGYAPLISLQGRGCQLIGSTVIGAPHAPIYEVLADGSTRSTSVSGVGFITRWTVSGDATARTITLPLANEGGSTFECLVSWGDGTSSVVTAYNDANRIHIYAADGTYNVEIRGKCEGWSFNNGGDKLKCTGVLHWGSQDTFNGFKYLVGGFYGCTNLTTIGIGKILPSGTGPTSFYTTFCNCGFTSIPAGLIDKLTNLTSIHTAFNGTPITAIPNDFFAYTPLIDNGTYAFCQTAITTTPASLAVGLGNLASCNYMFAAIPTLQIRADMFYSEAGRDTRFLGKAVDWSNAFFRTTFTGAQGTAPDLWNCDYGETITLDVAPETDWAAGDTITGQSSGATAEVVAKTSALVYHIKKHFGTFTLGEVIGVTGNAAKLADQGAAKPTFAGKPTSVGCFSGAGNSITSLTNYASIPASWK
jgi:hypothetical protein